MVRAEWGPGQRTHGVNMVCKQANVWIRRLAISPECCEPTAQDGQGRQEEGSGRPGVARVHREPEQAVAWPDVQDQGAARRARIKKFAEKMMKTRASALDTAEPRTPPPKARAQCAVPRARAAGARRAARGRRGGAEGPRARAASRAATATAASRRARARPSARARAPALARRGARAGSGTHTRPAPSPLCELLGRGDRRAPWVGATGSTARGGRAESCERRRRAREESVACRGRARARYCCKRSAHVEPPSSPSSTPARAAVHFVTQLS